MGLERMAGILQGVKSNYAPSSSGLPGGPPHSSGPWSMKISEHGPHGPVSPICQVYADDEDAATLWRKIAGFSDDRIIRIGTSDNFWQ
jgi:alanyl-tRNA synthetase